MKIKVRSKLGEYLDQRGIMKKWLADQVGADEAQVNRWCKNKDGVAVSTPSVGYLLRIKRTLGCKLEEIYEEIIEKKE
jgi:DNA-binding Xre family transcriptional regulator